MADDATKAATIPLVRSHLQMAAYLKGRLDQRRAFLGRSGIEILSSLAFAHEHAASALLDDIREVDRPPLLVFKPES